MYWAGAIMYPPFLPEKAESISFFDCKARKINYLRIAKQNVECKMDDGPSHRKLNY